MLTCFQCIHRSTIWALRTARAGHVEINLRVGAVYVHVRFGAGAVHAALGVQVSGEQLNVRGSGHQAQTLANQDAYLGLRPLTMSKNAA